MKSYDLIYHEEFIYHVNVEAKNLSSAFNKVRKINTKDLAVSKIEKYVTGVRGGKDVK